MQETWVQCLGWEDPLEESTQPTSVFLENPHGQRSPMEYSPWGHKKSDTTEWLNIQRVFRSQNSARCKVYRQINLKLHGDRIYKCNLNCTSCFQRNGLWNTSEQRRYLSGDIHTKTEIKNSLWIHLFIDSIAVKPWSCPWSENSYPFQKLTNTGVFPSPICAPNNQTFWVIHCIIKQLCCFMGFFLCVCGCFFFFFFWPELLSP